MNAGASAAARVRLLMKFMSVSLSQAVDGLHFYCECGVLSEIYDLTSVYDFVVRRFYYWRDWLLESIGLRCWVVILYFASCFFVSWKDKFQVWGASLFRGVVVRLSGYGEGFCFEGLVFIFGYGVVGVYIRCLVTAT
jgi:hypothetical protein